MNLLKSIIKNPSYYLYRVFVSKGISKQFQENLNAATDLESEMDHRLGSVIDFAIKTTPFYKELNVNFENDAGPLKKLGALPLIDRDTLKKNNGKFLSTAFNIGRAFNTSGTSGDPLFFYRSASIGSIDAAHQIDTFKKMGFEKGDRIISFNGFEPSDAKVKNNIYWQKNKLIGEFPFGSLSFSVNALNEKTFLYYYNYLELIKPAIIRGYPSAVAMFFKLMEQENKRFSFEIKGVLLTSENIYDHQVDLIKRISKSKIYRQYGHTECAMFAMTDADSEIYKFSPLYGYLEVLDESGNHVEKGGVGEVVVTSYHNFMQPFIRYKTGDLARYIGVVDGYQAIDKILGREQDFLITFEGNKIPITSIISGSHLSINEYITRWQIEQLEKGKIIVRTLLSDVIPMSCFEELVQVFKNYSQIEFIKVECIKLNKSGKHRFFIPMLIDL